ncbi:MAG: cell division protein ZapA [Tannerella sp.]|jgi:cell division protein ZapA|nr:cell division protein ZapA [Tannerella sp.]
MSDEEMLIQLEVFPGEKKYLVWIKPEDEQLVRKATMLLRQKFNAYKQTFSKAKLSDKDLLAMLAIDMATSHLRLEEKNDAVPFTKNIAKLTDELKDLLKEE